MPEFRIYKSREVHCFSNQFDCTSRVWLRAEFQTLLFMGVDFRDSLHKLGVGRTVRWWGCSLSLSVAYFFIVGIHHIVHLGCLPLKHVLVLQWKWAGVACTDVLSLRCGHNFTWVLMMLTFVGGIWCSHVLINEIGAGLTGAKVFANLCNMMRFHPNSLAEDACINGDTFCCSPLILPIQQFCWIMFPMIQTLSCTTLKSCVEISYTIFRMRDQTTLRTHHYVRNSLFWV